MRYRVELRPRARSYLRKLPANLQRLIIEHLEALEPNPRPPWCKRLGRDLKGRWSFRVSDYRVVYRIDDDVLVVLVLEIGPRGKVYEDAARDAG